MRAVVYYGPKDIRVEEFAKPCCKEGEILVKVDACAVCGSDMKAYNVGNPRLQPPIVMGHEFTGLIEQLGEGVSGYSLGDRVVMATSVSCGECLYCKRGLNNLCRDLAPMGFSYNGGMAEWVSIPKRAVDNGHVIVVAKDIKPEYAALAEPLSCAVNSVKLAEVERGDVVVVIGAGPMGILNGVVAQKAGAVKVIFAELNSSRLEQCKQFNFTRLVNPAKESLSEVVFAETDGYGADVVIVAAPAAAPQEQAVDLVRKQGRVVLFASLPAGKCDITLNSRTVHYNEIKIMGSSDSTPKDVERAVELLSDDSFPASELASHILPLDGVKEAFDLMEKGESLRVVLK